MYVARLALLLEHALPHSVNLNCLRLGLFSMYRQPSGQAGKGNREECDGEEGNGGRGASSHPSCCSHSPLRGWRARNRVSVSHWTSLGCCGTS